MGLFIVATIVFTIVSIIMILIILVQRPQGGGLAGAFGGASGGSADTVFGGRVGDALTAMTVGAFVLYLLLALGLNILDNRSDQTVATPTATTQPDPNAMPTPTVDSSTGVPMSLMPTNAPVITPTGTTQTFVVPPAPGTPMPTGSATATPAPPSAATPASPPPATPAPSTPDAPPAQVAPPATAPSTGGSHP